MGEYLANRPVPRDIQLLAQNDTIVNMIVQAWRAGMYPTWEHALTAMVTHLVEANRKHLDRAVELAALQPPPPIIIQQEPPKGPDNPLKPGEIRYERHM